MAIASTLQDAVALTLAKDERVTAWYAAREQMKTLEILQATKSEQLTKARAEAQQLRATMGQRLLAGVLANDESGAEAIIQETAAAALRADVLTQVLLALNDHVVSYRDSLNIAYARKAQAEAEANRNEMARRRAQEAKEEGRANHKQPPGRKMAGT